MSKIIDKNKIYIYGRNPVFEKLKNSKEGVLFIQSGSDSNSIKEILERAKSSGIKISFVEKVFFNQNFSNKNHQGVVFQYEDNDTLMSEEEFNTIIRDEIDKNEIILLLDGIKDVGNLGSILRSSLLFGVNYVVMPKDNSCPVNDVVIKRSSGAAHFVKVVYVTNLVKTITLLKENGFWIYASDKNGTSLGEVKFNKKSAIIMGEEGRGIRRLVKENSDMTVTIPTTKKIDSLNVASSVSIILYSYFIQKF